LTDDKESHCTHSSYAVGTLSNLSYLASPLETTYTLASSARCAFGFSKLLFLEGSSYL